LAATLAGLPGIAIRQERPADGPQIRSRVDAAFAPSTLEGRIVDALRASDRWVPGLALVAVDGSGSIVGHVVTSRGDLTSPDGSVRPILALGPWRWRRTRRARGSAAP
jgi:putative acetyltransferase